ncbi:MAG: hypothetical protein RMY35_016885 [Nostoc sp. DedSLP01]|nr:hypothetical protein [Nostoc sp. DedSLP05]MDZ8097268.1 hypothetical protein [Nostoc sp. DedSLP01]
MDNWQFLIQKQGDRSWHILESPNLQILEGQYRVLARSSLRNTDVEVRVTHFSTHEATPKRRIFKRSRRINSEGLMAVIPFTDFEPGIWELRCCGDLMSDMLGKSWQYSIQVQVLSQEVWNREDAETIPPHHLITPPLPHSQYPIADAPSPVETPDKAIAIPTDSSLETAVVPDTSKQEDTDSSFETAVVVDAIEQQEDTDSSFETAGVVDAIEQEDTVSSFETAGVVDAIEQEDTASSFDIAVVNAAKQEDTDTPDTNVVADAIEQEEDTDSSLEIAVVNAAKQEDTASDRSGNPVWLKGETAEQILQNLIELALPTSEPLSEDEEVVDSSETQQPQPLLLTLDRDTYVACWGQALTINGRVELEEKTNLEFAETGSPKSVRGLELKIELRSPLEPQILSQVRRPLPDQDLPFTIGTSIDIPAECESKLILADISLYGRLTEIGELIHLASYSFSITADVTELLAIATAPKPSTSSNKLTAPSASSDNFTEPEAAVKLDLKLLNLVKLRKTDQPQLTSPSSNTPTPPQINLEVLREATRKTSQHKTSATLPQLPKLPPIQIDVNTSTDVVAESPTQSELVEKDATVTAINLEQLLIKQRRIPILDTTFPFLKRVQATPSFTEVINNTSDTLEIAATEDSLHLGQTLAEEENTTEVQPQVNLEFQEQPAPQVLPQPNPEFHEESAPQVQPELYLEFQEESAPQVLPQVNLEFQEEPAPQVLPQLNPEFIQTKLYSSPLLRKWMQSQGYSLPETINELPPQSYENYLPVEQTPPSVNAESPNDDVLDINLLLSLDANTEILEDTDTQEKADLSIQENTEVEQILEEPTFSPPLVSQVPPPPPPINTVTASAWLEEEIVVDDTYSESETNVTNSYVLEEEEQPLSDLSRLLAISAEAIEPLPIPQLHVPEGELIAGKSVMVRVVMPEVTRQVAIKLWVEDCQTRWLLDGPHLLTNLLPNALGGLEVMTQLNISFGCLEIRIEAIALDPTTQQESHKVTIVRTVIPPDLPNLELDELLGI